MILAAGGGYVLWAHLPLQQALNGLLAALMFNIIYDVLLSQVRGCTVRVSLLGAAVQGRMSRRPGALLGGPIKRAVW